MSYSKTLNRQIKRLLQNQDLDALAPFLQSVDKSYQHFEENRVLLERSMALSDEELTAANQKLRDETDQQKLLLKQLKHAILTLRNEEENVQSLAGQDELLHLSTILQTQIRKQKRTEAALSEARDAAQQANNTKSEFLANMSHEIRTPMNAIIGMTELLMEEVEEGDTEALTEGWNDLKMIHTSANHLLNLLNEILDFSKIEAGKLKLEHIEFNLWDVLESSCDSFALQTHKKGLELLLDIDPQTPLCMQGDPARLRQIIHNLLGNAIKFTSKGEIIVRTRYQAACDDILLPARLRIEVQDSGIGIPEDRLAKVFESFTQADTSTTRIYGGTGLGLSICQHLVRLMGGDLDVTSEAGSGSRFYFTLPIENCDPASKTQAPHYPAFPQSQILVLNHHAPSRVWLGKLLHPWGIQVHYVRNELEAQQYLNARHYDAMLVDQNALSTAQAQPLDPTTCTLCKHKNCPVLLMVQRCQRPDMQETRQLLEVDILDKPIKQVALYQWLEKSMQT